MKLSDESSTPKGDVLVQAWDRNRVPLPDQSVIFANPGEIVMEDGFVVLDHNLVVNGGRQVIANLLGGKGWDDTVPNKDWIVTHVRFGTYDQAPRFTDLTLSPQPQAGVFDGGENTILVDGSESKKLITAVDWPQPFIVRFEIELGPDEAVGYQIREMGLYTHNDTLFARKTMVPVNKSADFGLTWLWRVRC